MLYWFITHFCPRTCCKIMHKRDEYYYALGVRVSYRCLLPTNQLVEGKEVEMGRMVQEAFIVKE